MFRCQRAAHVVGTVTGEGDAPLVDASVYLCTWSYEYDCDYVNNANVLADGSFNVGGLRAGVYRVLVNPAYESGYLSEFYQDAYVREAATPITVTAAATYTLGAVNLQRSASIAGIVTDPNGDPLPDTAVYLCYVADGTCDGENYTYEYAYTDEAGLYMEEGLLPGAWLVRFAPYWQYDYMTQWYDDAALYAEATPVVLAGGEARSGINAQMRPYPSVSGKISLGDGMEYGNVTVYLCRLDIDYSDCDGFDYYTYTSPDEDGDFLFTQVNAGAYTAYAKTTVDWSNYRTIFWNQKPSIGSADIFTVTEESVTNVDIIFNDTASVAGSVYDASSREPVAGAQLTLCWYVGGECDDAEHALADSMGDYSFATLLAGDYRLLVEDPTGLHVSAWYSAATSLASALPIVLAQDEAHDNVDLVMTLATGTSTIAGRVTDSSGTPIAGITVEWCIYTYGMEHECIGSTTTDGNGEYTTPELPARAYRMRFSHPTGPLLHWSLRFW